jgi:hypothetical protein
MQTNNEILEDYEYWHTIIQQTKVKTPNKYEVSIFKRYIKGRVLLLGETKALIELADEGLDLFPSGFAKKGDWFDMSGYYGTIIGDGCLNLENGFLLISAIKNHCDRFICRVFGNEIKEEYTWKYAKYFWDAFPDSSVVIKTQKGCYMVIWDFIK